jgi:hypothetical protein
VIRYLNLYYPNATREQDSGTASNWRCVTAKAMHFSGQGMKRELSFAY